MLELCNNWYEQYKISENIGDKIFKEILDLEVISISCNKKEDFFSYNPIIPMWAQTIPFLRFLKFRNYKKQCLWSQPNWYPLEK